MPNLTKLFPLVIGIMFFACNSQSKHEVKEVNKNIDSLSFIPFDMLVPISKDDTGEVAEVKRLFASNLKAFDKKTVVQSLGGSEYIRLTLAFAQSPPIQLILKDGELICYELDKIVRCHVSDSIQIKGYNILQRTTIQSTLDVNVLFDRVYQSGLCSDFSDFEGDLGFDATIALLELVSKNEACQIGFVLSKARLREYIPHEIMRLLMREFPIEVIETGK